MGEFKPSVHQQKIFDNIKRGYNNLVINAVAGSGKTSTIVKSLELIPENKKILFIAFNKDIVEELNHRVGKSENINIVTYHSLGSSILRENVRGEGKCTLDVYKYNIYVKNNIDGLSNGSHKLMKKGKYNSYITNILALINFSRFNLAQSHKEIEFLCNKYSITTLSDEIDVVLKVLEWGVDNVDTIDYTDMIWIPTEKDFKTNRFKYDWVFIDEAQDSSIVQQKLIERCFNRGSHFCAVGDTFQCINAWAGADSEAFNNFISKTNTQTFDLPISYRCPQEVVKLAQNFVPQIIYRPDAIEGKINHGVSLYKPIDGDMVVCRNTEPLVRLYSKYLRINKKCYIKGKDLGENLISIINDTNIELLNKEMTNDGVFSRLFEKFFTLRDLYMSKYNIDEIDAIMSPQVISFYENIKSIQVLAENMKTKTDLINKIKNIFIDNGKEGVCLTTIHKSKGLEAENVFILCPSMIPSHMAKTEWELEAEKNLEYVAITRAKKTLNYMDESTFKSYVFHNNQHQLIKEVREVEATLLRNRLWVSSYELEVESDILDVNSFKKIIIESNEKVEDRKKNPFKKNMNKFIK